MKRGIKTLVLLFIFNFQLVFFYACNSCNKNGSTEIKKGNSSFLEDTLIKKLPKDKNGNIANFYFLKDKAEHRAGFNTLEKGFDSLCIRIWYGYTFSDTEQVVEIKCTKSLWTATLSNLFFFYAPNSDSIISIKKSFISNTPKSGWKFFIDSLYALDILNLPNYEGIPNYNVPSDASAVNVQIATKNNYQLYQFASPIVNIKRIEDALKMEKIMDLIEEELDFRRIRKI